MPESRVFHSLSPATFGHRPAFRSVLHLQPLTSMKLTSLIKILTALIFSAALPSFALAHEGHIHDKADPATDGSVLKADAAGVSADWLTKAKAEYPIDTC